MVILILGATGKNGSEVVKMLLEAKAQVRAAVRDLGKAENLAKLGAELTLFDYEKPDTVEAAVKGVESLLLLTPMAPDGTPMVKLVVDAAKKAGVKFILRFSAAGSNPDGISVAKDHGLCENIVKESGIDWAVIQPTFFMENFLYFHSGVIKEQGQWFASSGDGAISYISVHDISASITGILLNWAAHVGKTYILTGPTALKDAEIATIISDAIGKEVKYVDVPHDDYLANVKKQMPEWLAEGLAFLEGVKRQGWASGVSPAVKEVTGKDPMDFKTWFADHIAAFK